MNYLYEEIEDLEIKIEKQEEKLMHYEWDIDDYKLTIEELQKEIENNIKVCDRSLEEDIPKYLKELIKAHKEFDNKLIRIIKGEE